MVMRTFRLSLLFLLFLCAPVLAEDDNADHEALAIFGTACENIKSNEQLASTRAKATDKASYAAVSALSEIVNIKPSFNDHDFSVMVYNIVDDYIEDLIIKTTKQTNSELCVEVSGYVTLSNIGTAIETTLKQLPEEEELPAPPEEIKKSFIVNTVFIKPTEFYNGTHSRKYSLILGDLLSNSENILVIDNPEEAAFVVTPQILKAKIEPLNTTNGRMQMVVALQVLNRQTNVTTTEHQSKFVLYHTDEDEQATARELMTDLFKQGAASIIRNIAEKQDGQDAVMPPEPVLPNADDGQSA